MNSTNNKTVRRYLKEVFAKLNCSRSLKSAFISELKGEILQFTESRESITLDDIYDQFGTPEDIANGFYDRKDYELILKKAKKKAIIWMVIAVILTIILTIVIISTVLLIIEVGGSAHVTNATYK